MPQTSLSSFVFFLALDLAATGSAWGQEVRAVQPGKIVKQFVAAKVTRPVGYTSLPAVPFQPFKYELPPGTPVDPNSKIKLPNGVTVTARDYIDSLNRIERGLAQVGHTMRATSGHLIGTKYADDTLFAKQVSAYHNSIPAKFTNRSLSVPTSAPLIKGLVTAPISSGVKPIQSPSIVSKPSSPNQTKSGTTVKGTPSQEKTSFNPAEGIHFLNGAAEYFNQGFNGSFGDSNFGASISAHLKVTGQSNPSPTNPEFQGTISEMHAIADMEAGAQIMGNSFPLLQFNADFEGSDKTETRSYDLGLYVGGVQIFHDHDSASGPTVNWQDGFSINWDAQSPTFVYPLFGPFEMKGFVGVKGDAGLAGSFKVGSFRVEGQIAPFVTAAAYGEITAGVDLGVASADVGVDANLVLIDDHLAFKLDSGIAWDPANHFDVVQNCALTNDLTTMSGSFSLVAHVYGPWGFKLYDWSTELAGWPGESSHLDFFKPATTKLDWH